MTASELASFRALLQAQAAAQPGPDRGLFARMRARLTVVEGGRGAATASSPTCEAAPARAASSIALVAEDTVAAGPLADPPPSQPPTFGRRDVGAPSPSPCARVVDMARGGPDPAVVLELTQAVRLAHRAAQPTGPSTPDELDDLRPAEPASRPDAPTPGVIAGWSRARPPSAQRRLLGRLEAVLLAEREGLDARRMADAPAA